MAAIHRGPDGYMPVAHKDADGVWQELGTVAIGQPLIPELLDHLATDGYFALNSSFGTGRRKTGTRKVWKPLRRDHPEYGALSDYPAGAVEQVEVSVTSTKHPVTGLPFQQHQSDDLRWLNVCHVDIDCYNLNLSIGDALGAIIDMQDAGQIPPATMFARSGRGLWAFWYLLDPGNPETGTVTLYNAVHTPTTPQRAHRRAIAFYAKIQHALAARLRHLGADIGALDGCRFAPVPGTLKSSTNTRVEYWVQGAHGQGYAYTLRGLGEALGVEMREREHPIIEAALVADPATHAAKSKAGRKGWEVRYRNLLGDMETLLNLRGGGFHVNRHRSLWLYATVLRKNGMSQLDVERRVRKAARKCSRDAHGDGITDQEAGTAVRTAFKGKTGINPTAARLYAELRVTDKEASYLKTIKPAVVVPPVKPRTTDERHAAIQAIVARLGCVPSCREMAGYTKAQGFDANHTTIWRDYHALQLSPVKKLGRPKKQRLLL